MRRTRPGQDFIEREGKPLPADPRKVAAGVVPGVLDRVPLGTPPVDFDVRSTFDVRPVNGTDFTFSATSQPTAIGESGATWSFEFSVPNGFVAVVRWFQFWAGSPTGSNTEIKDWVASLQRNGVDFAYNTGIYIGPVSERMPCFMLVDELNTFGVFVTNATIDGAPDAYLNIHGNLLIKTGRAFPYEIANPVGAAKSGVIAPAQALRPPPPPPPKRTTRDTRWVKHSVPSQDSTPRPAAPAPIETPPFDLTWIKQTVFAVSLLATEGKPTVKALVVPAGNSMFWVPAALANGGRSSRGLTEQEAQTYKRYIQAHPPGGGGSGNSGGGGNYRASAR